MVTPETIALIDAAKASFVAGGSPFTGPVANQDGEIVWAEGDTPTYADIETDGLLRPGRHRLDRLTKPDPGQNVVIEMPCSSRERSPRDRSVVGPAVVLVHGVGVGPESFLDVARAAVGQTVDRSTESCGAATAKPPQANHRKATDRDLEPRGAGRSASSTTS